MVDSNSIALPVYPCTLSVNRALLMTGEGIHEFHEVNGYP